MAVSPQEASGNLLRKIALASRRLTIEQPQVELRAFALAEPEAEQFFAAFYVDSDHDVERLLDDPPFVSHFEEERIQVEDRPDCL